jgi:hypothetical protein
MTRYCHRQIGWPALIGSVPPFLVGLIVVGVGVPAGYALVVAAPAVFLLLGWLTVSVSDEALDVRFGVGLIGRRIALANISSARIVRNPWYYGWGIRRIPGGWLYNVAGFESVEVTLDSGDALRIGTDEPITLKAALAARVRLADDARGDDAISPASAKWALAPAIIIGGAVIVLVSVLFWNGRQPVDVTIGNGRVTVQGAGYSAFVALHEIAEVALIDTLPAIVAKLNGNDDGSKLRGHFSVAGLGPCDVFVDRETPPFVVIRASSSALIVNQSTADETRRLRDDLLRAIGR